jgi:hypothetical protein
MMVEKWPAPDSSEPPFSAFLQALEEGRIRMSLNIAQGPMSWERVTEDGQPRMQRVLAPEAMTDLAPTS